MKLPFSTLVLLASLLAGACAPPQTPATDSVEYANQAKAAYDEALREFLEANWEKAALLMAELRRNYAHSPYAHLAHLRIADIAYRQDKFPEAVAEYKAFVREHPNHPEVPYARYRALRSQFLTSGNSVFQPSLEERDLAHVRDAYTSIRAFLADFPNYEEHDELRYMYQSVSGLLYRHEIYVARFYLNRDEFEAAVRRVQYAMRTYSETGLEPEGVVLLGEIYLKLKKPRKAEAMFRYVLSHYPESAFVIPAQKFLDYQHATGAVASAALPAAGAR